MKGEFHLATPAEHVQRPISTPANPPSQSIEEMGKEAFALIRDRIKGHMYVNGLRADGMKLNNTINEVYAEFLVAKATGKDSITFENAASQKAFLEKVKGLARFADLAEGNATLNQDLLNADLAALRMLVDKQRSGDEPPLTDEYFLYYLRDKEARDNLPRSMNISQGWQSTFANHDQYLPPPSADGVGPAVVPGTGKTIPLEELLAMGGPTPLMRQFSEAAYQRAPRNTGIGYCARFVNRTMQSLGLVNGALGHADAVPNRLAQDPDFVEVTGVSAADLNRLPAGCFVSYLNAREPDEVGHNQVTVDPATHQFTNKRGQTVGCYAVSDFRQESRSAYGSIMNVRVFIPRGGIKST